MYYSTNPVTDAARYNDEQYARAERAEAVQDDWHDEIVGAFERQSDLPYIDGRSGRVRHQTFLSGVSDVMERDDVLKAFAKMMRESKDPAVAEFRNTMLATYEHMWLDDLVEFSMSR